MCEKIFLSKYIIGNLKKESNYLSVFFNRFCWIVWHTQFDLVRPGNWSPSRYRSRPSERSRNVGPDLDWRDKIVVLWLRFLCSFMGHALRNLRSKMGGTFQWSHLLHVNWQQHDFGKIFFKRIPSIVSFKTSLSTKFNRLCWPYIKHFSILMHPLGEFQAKNGHDRGIEKESVISSLAFWI